MSIHGRAKIKMTVNIVTSLLNKIEYSKNMLIFKGMIKNYIS